MEDRALLVKGMFSSSNFVTEMASYRAMVEHSPNHPNVKGLSLTALGEGKKAKNITGTVKRG
jgi:hypothetical protein